MKNKLIISVAFLLFHMNSYACELCKKRQPKGFENITHGNGPETMLDYWILYGSIGIVALTMILFVKYSLKPNRNSFQHTNNQIFIK
jgi:hypothetical protein